MRAEGNLQHRERRKSRRMVNKTGHSPLDVFKVSVSVENKNNIF